MTAPGFALGGVAGERRLAAAWPLANRAAAALVAVGVPFAAFASLILFHYYERGAFLMDTGLIAALIWHGDAAQTLPDALGGGSFLATHVSPLFLPLSALSRVLPFTQPVFLAGFMGLGQALLALPVFWLVLRRFGAERAGAPGLSGPSFAGPSFAAPWLAACAALGFAFSGLALAIARYPHFETLIAAFLLLFAAARTLGHPRVAAVCFVLGLATREDAGLHYLGVLGLLAALDLGRGVSPGRWRGTCAYALAGLLYAVAALAFQHAAFPAAESSLVRVYLGDPPFAHVTPALLAERLAYLCVSRPYVVLPALGALAWAVRARDAALFLGFAAGLPWLALHMMARSPTAGAFVSYYAFPFLIGLAWPLLARTRDGGGVSARTLAGFAALLALTYPPAADPHDPGRLAWPEAFLNPPSTARMRATDAGVAAIGAARPDLGTLRVDNSVAALLPTGFPRGDLEGAAPPDTVAFLAEGYDNARLRALADLGGLRHRYRVPGTHLRLASRRRLEEIPALARIVAAE